MGNNNNSGSGYIWAAVIGGIFLLLSIYLGHYLSGNVNTYNTTNNVQPISNTPSGGNQNSTAFQCPSTDQTASLMNFAQGSVNDGGASCVYHWGDTGTTTDAAHCPTGYGASSVELTPVQQPPKALVIECNGNDNASLPNMYGATIRFEQYNSNWNACEITKEHRARLQDGVQGPSGC